MSEGLETHGVWWRPEAPDDRWTGTLIAGHGHSPELTITTDEDPFTFADMGTPSILLGHDAQGKPVTLLFPGPPQARGGMALTRATFSIGTAILGLELAAPKDFLVNTLFLNAQHLNAWLGISGFKQQTTNDSCDCAIAYLCPPDQSFSLGSELTLGLRTSYTFAPKPHEQTIKEETYLMFESPRGLDLVECRRLIHATRALLHFASLKPVYMLDVNARKKDFGPTYDGTFIPQEITILDSTIHGDVASEPLPSRWIFQFPDLKHRFGEFWAMWFDFLQEFKEPLSCYFATVYKRLSSELSHLCLAQALEAYHGIKFGKEDFAPRIQAVTTQFLPHLSGLVSDPVEFAKEVRDNRNYYTHHDPKIKQHGRVKSGAELIRLNEKLKLIFQMCILSDLGIPADRFIRLRKQLASEIIMFE